MLMHLISSTNCYLWLVVKMTHSLLQLVHQFRNFLWFKPIFNRLVLLFFCTTFFVMNRGVYKKYNQKLTRETVDFSKYTFLWNIILEYLTAYNFQFSVNKKKSRIFQSLYTIHILSNDSIQHRVTKKRRNFSLTC